MDAFTSYDFDFRITLLLLAHIIALIIGGPRWLHHIILYDLPARLWKRFLSALEQKLNRVGRTTRAKSVRGRIVFYFAATLCFVLGFAIMSLSVMTEWGWGVELIILAYLLPARASLLVLLELKEGIAQKDAKKTYACANTLPTVVTEQKDIYGALRGAISYAAECIPRYVIVPALLYMLTGIIGVLIYRLMSIWSDMFSQSQHISYSKTAHLWTRIVSFIPYHLACIISWLALAFVPKASVPNAAQAFSGSLKGALAVKLAAYGFGLTLGGVGLKDSYGHNKTWVGSRADGRAKVTVNDLSRAIVWNAYSLAVWMVALMVIAAFRLQ